MDVTGVKGMVLPPVSHLGVVVRDVKKVIDFYSRTFGIGPFKVSEIPLQKCWVKGKLTPCRIIAGTCQWGQVELELIEVVEGDPPNKRFLEEKGEGLHHLGFNVDNYDKWMNHLKENGIEALLNVETDLEGVGHIRTAYVESNYIGGIIFELFEITPE